tara:strand:- start:362 stop:520 length:159 start_codon:yes stop_codon:yes gene_type:complete
MEAIKETTPLNEQDKNLLSDLTSTFDLVTQTIIGLDQEDIFNELKDLNRKTS